jgi:hypothetical protein
MAQRVIGRPFPKGTSGNPGGRSRLDTMVRFDLREAARALCPRSIEVIRECLEHKDARIRLMAAQLAMERGFGKPEIKAEVTTHAFVVCPEVMDEALWLERRGQPLIEGKAAPLPQDAPTTLDRTPSDEPDPTKLN